MIEVLKNYENIKYYNKRCRPISVSWDVTNQCNMKCLHCFNDSGNADKYDFHNELSKEQAINIANQIVQIRPNQCCICGGETLLFKYLFDVIKILTSNEIMTNLVSNGYLMTFEMAQKLKESGVNNVQISVDGLGFVHDVFRQTKNAFSHAINAIKVLQKANINVLVSLCPNKMNYLQLEDCIEYLSNIGCNEVRMMPLLSLGRGKINYERLMLDSEQQFDFTQRIALLRNKYPSIDLEWGDPLEHIHLILLTKRKYPVVMSIQSNGDLSITPYIPIVVGNVKKKSLSEYWESGYNIIWSDKRILDIIRDIRSIYDLHELNKKNIYIDL